MSERKASGQPSLLPRWAWLAPTGSAAALGIVMIIYSFSTEKWTSVVWYGVLTVGMGALLLRHMPQHGKASRPATKSDDASPAAFSWDDPSLKRGAAIFVVVCAGIGLLGVAVVLRGAGIGSPASGQDRWFDLIVGLVLALIGLGTSVRVMWRWHRRAPLRQS